MAAPDPAATGSAPASPGSSQPGEAPAATPPADAPSAAASPPTAWTVAPGESFWTIAESLLATALGRPPTDAETARYWTRLIEANRDRLHDPANADLLFTGQVLTVFPP